MSATLSELVLAVKGRLGSALVAVRESDALPLVTLPCSDAVPVSDVAPAARPPLAAWDSSVSIVISLARATVACLTCSQHPAQFSVKLHAATGALACVRQADGGTAAHTV